MNKATTIKSKVLFMRVQINRSFLGIGQSLYMVKLLVLFQKEIVKLLTKVLSDPGEYNSKTAIMRGIKPKDQVNP